MDDFIYYVTKARAISTEKRKEVIACYRDASLNNPLFNDNDKERTYCYVNDTKTFTPFSLDTDWEKAYDLMRTSLPVQQPPQEAPQQQQPAQRPQYTESKQNLDEPSETQKAMQQAAHAQTSRGPVERRPIVNNQPRVGRNDPCPCGSGKCCHCHGI